MSSGNQQLLPGFDTLLQTSEEPVLLNGSNTLDYRDRAIHDWHRFVLSFPPHLVRHYIEDFGLGPKSTVLDPFCGTGTTLVEAKLNGIGSVGVEAHPFSHFANSVKVDWEIDPFALEESAEKIASGYISVLKRQGLDARLAFGIEIDKAELKRLDPQRQKLLIKDSTSPLPLHKSLILKEQIDKSQIARHYDHLRLAFANALVFSVCPTAVLHLADSRKMDALLAPETVDAVITSPPYPNEKDYTRTTRLESVMLGFINSRKELRCSKQDLLRSNTRGVYKGDNDDQWISTFAEIQEIAQSIEKRRKELGKTSGFERMYHRVTKLYFGGMARHLASLRQVLKPGAHLVYVVGDQASYLRVMIRTGHLLAQIAEHLGYELVRIDLFRKRFATATREELREEVVILRWPGYEGQK